MQISQNIILFLFGVAMGSAGNAIIDRLPRNESWVTGRSHCDKCGHVLNTIDLIPIFSYLFLQGKCRYCHKLIPYRNVLIEIIMGLGAIFLTNSFLIFWVTVVIAVMDWETRMVSEWLIFFWGILVIMGNWGNFGNWGNLLGVIIIGGIWAVSKGRAMGFGDVEIALVMGLALGWPKIIFALWVAFVAGAIVGLMMMARKQAKAKSVIAFGPFLIFGYWLAYLFGNYVKI